MFADGKITDPRAGEQAVNVRDLVGRKVAVHPIEENEFWGRKKHPGDRQQTVFLGGKRTRPVLLGIETAGASDQLVETDLPECIDELVVCELLARVANDQSRSQSAANDQRLLGNEADVIAAGPANLSFAGPPDPGGCQERAPSWRSSQAR